MKTVCDLNMCAGCMACVQKCPKNAISIVDDLKQYNAVIDKDKCIDCNICHKVCPQNNTPLFRGQLECWQGWSNDFVTRSKGASGGAACAISKAFISSGGYVCSCCFENGEFVFRTVSDVNDVDHFRGSKYVKSNPANAYKTIFELISSGEKVLFIGLPCQVAGVKNFIGEKLYDKLYTIDLICHGTPSPLLLQSFLKEKNLNALDVGVISFREGNNYQLSLDGNYVGSKGTSDLYSISFLSSLINTDSCYLCKYAKSDRISDVTLGDSWGSTLPSEEHKRGISLILVQTDKGKELLNSANLHLCEVDMNIAISSNKQLNRPSECPKKRDIFFNGMSNGKTFSKMASSICIKRYLKQKVKGVLIKLGLYKA